MISQAGQRSTLHRADGEAGRPVEAMVTRIPRIDSTIRRTGRALQLASVGWGP
jgi:hypothetical protein